MRSIAGTSTACPTDKCSDALPDAEALFPSVAENNVAILAACRPVDPRCKPCTSPDAATCIADVFAAPPSFAQLLSQGWRLKPNGPCLLARGGFDLTARVPRDHYGALRTTPVSVGAHEDDGPCQPPSP